jgi:hypothetical protein
MILNVKNYKGDMQKCHRILSRIQKCNEVTSVVIMKVPIDDVPTACESEHPLCTLHPRHCFRLSGLVVKWYTSFYLSLPSHHNICSS